MTTQPAPAKFPLPPPALPYDLAPELRTLMERQPVTHVELPDGGTAWLATGFREVREVLTDQRYSRALAVQAGGVQRGTEMIAARTLLGMDPPEHTRLRTLIASAFTQRRMQSMRPKVARAVDGLLDQMIAQPRPVDLFHAFSLPLPAGVICELLGVPAGDLEKFHDWSDTLMGSTERSEHETATAYFAFMAYMADLVAAKRDPPGDDLISALISARDESGRLSEDELVQFCFLLLMAGHETTANQINMSLVALLDHPEQLDWLRANLDRMPGAIEELLRFVLIGSGLPPPRVTREEVVLGGVTIPAGEMVIPLMSVTGRDPSVFPDPGRLDLSRVPKTHLIFGAGAHHCVGAQLARMQLQEAFRGLLTRLPGLRLAVPVSGIAYKEKMILHSMRELPVTWEET